MLGLVQVYLDLDLPEGSSGDAVEREMRFAHGVLERVAQEIRHRAADERLRVEEVRVGVVRPQEG